MCGRLSGSDADAEGEPSEAEPLGAGEPEAGTEAEAEGEPAGRVGLGERAGPAGVAAGVAEAAPQPARKTAARPRPSSEESVALERRIIYYPDRLCAGPPEHGFSPGGVSNAPRTIFCLIR
jgi:hypothetical protein